MSKVRTVEASLGQAKKTEKKYDWLGAVDFYEKASSFALGKKVYGKAGLKVRQVGLDCDFR